MDVLPGRRALLRAAAAFCAAAACRAVPAAAQDRGVIVFAAASLKTALDAIVAEYRQQTGRPVRVSYAASSALARQIEAGAPADLFLSADRDWMDYLQARGLIRPETRRDLLSNQLVLIAPKASAAQAAIAPGFPLDRLLGDGRLAMADTSAVPAGRYGKAALQALGVWASVQDRIAQAENVRTALALVSRGEAPLGIVYRTDAAADPNVKVLDTFPEATHPPIVYPTALTVQAGAGAADFLAWLTAPAARRVFEQQGFGVLRE